MSGGEAHLPRNLRRLRELLPSGGRWSAEQCSEVLSTHGVALSATRIAALCDRYDAFDVDPHGIARAVASPIGADEAPPAHRLEEDEHPHEGWRVWQRAVPVHRVFAGATGPDGEWRTIPLGGGGTEPGVEDVILVHPDHEPPASPPPPAPTADLTLLALLVDPTLPELQLEILAEAFASEAGRTSAELRPPLELTRDVARSCLDLVDEEDPSWPVVTRALARAGDPLARVLPDGEIAGKLDEHLLVASDPLVSQGPSNDTSTDPVGRTARSLKSLEAHGYPHRSGQREMATFTATVLHEGRRGAVEAPTGTGKSFGYLLAAAAEAVDRQRPVIVATHTKVLQAQLRRDAERLRSLGELPVPFRQIQGVSNYVCARELAEALEADAPDPGAYRALAVALRVLAVNPAGTWNAVSDDVQMRSSSYRVMRASLRTDAAGCERDHCKWAHRCPLIRAMTDLEEHPGIVSVNHALLASWAQRESEAGDRGRWLLRRGRSGLVIDEAHTLEDSLTSAWTATTGDRELSFLQLRISSRRGIDRAVRDVLRQLERTESSPDLVQKLRSLLRAVRASAHELSEPADELATSAAAYVREFGTDGTVDLAPAVVAGRTEFRALVADAFAVRTRLEDLAESTSALLSALQDAPSVGDERPVASARRRLTGLLSAVAEHRALLLGLEDLQEPERVVHLLKVDDAEDSDARWSYEQVPISVALPFRSHVVGRMRATVLTSATLRVAGSWEYLNGRLGIDISADGAGPEGFDGRAVQSPFDHRQQARLILTSHLPLPLPATEQEFVEATARDHLGFLSLTGGRALSLFAARRRMNAVVDELRDQADALAERGVSLLMQGEATPSTLSARFRRDEGSVAFGLRSYWEGFDAPGPTLSYLLLEKAPYPSISDPLIRARQRRVQDDGGDPFLHYLVPLAAIQLAQGFGRLIRSTDDRGAALVLDRRLQLPTAANHLLIRSLPDVGVHLATDAADAWTHAIEFVTGEEPDLTQALAPPVDDVSQLLAELRKRVRTEPEQVLREAARALFGIEELRPEQLRLMSAVLEGRDALGFLPTGAGKSLCFQLPALVREDAHPTVVISPLIALIKDQVDELRSRRRLHEVQGITGRTSAAERTVILQDLHRGRVRLLYVSPERFVRDPALRRALASSQLGSLVVDEAHCVSLWGLDFRPEFRQLVAALEDQPRSPRLGLTATATSEVEADLHTTLELREPVVVRHPADRPNLTFQVREAANEVDRVRELLRFVTHARELEPDRPGVVYVWRRATAEQVAFVLRASGFPSRHFHAGMVPEQRESVQEQFMSGLVPIIVATKAFGMGVNKPDIAWVVHHDLPDSLESYVQESGRAARDTSLRGTGLLLFTRGDITRRRKMLDRSDLDGQRARAHALLRQLAAAPQRGSDRVIDPEEVAGDIGCELDELNVTLAWLERTGTARRTADRSRRMAVTAGFREPADPDGRRRFRELFWRVLDAKAGQRRLLDLEQTASLLECTADELEELLFDWTLDGIVTATTTQRLWSIRLTSTYLDDELLQKHLQEWRRWERERLDEMIEHATTREHCRRVGMARSLGDDVPSCLDRPAGTVEPCDVCDPDPRGWERLPGSRIPDPERAIDPEVVLLQAVLWTERFEGGRYGAKGLRRAILGQETLGSGRPLGPGLLRLPQFGALRYLRAADRRLTEAQTNLAKAGQITVTTVLRDGVSYESLATTELGRRRLGHVSASLVAP